MSLSDMIILGELNKKPSHGYELSKTIREQGMHNHSGIKIPSVYKSLNKLEKKGYIAGIKIEGDKNPSRTVYQLSEEGYQYFTDLVRKSLITYKKTRNEFWIALNYIDNIISRDDFLKALNERIANINAEVDKLTGQLHSPGNLPLQVEYMLKMSLKFKNAEIEVLNEMLNTINHKDISTLSFKHKEHE